jgi:hypothetical protein
MEKAMDNASAAISWFNFHGLKSGAAIEPQVGPTNYGDINAKIEVVVSTTSADITAAWAAGAPPMTPVTSPLLPGRLTITLSSGIVITDNGLGYLVAPAGVLAGAPTANTVNYQTGVVTGTLAAADTFVIVAYLDQTAQNGIGQDALSPMQDNIIKVRQEYAWLATYPEVLMSQVDIVSIMALSKVVDYQEKVADALQVMYTQKINKRLVDALIQICRDSDAAGALDPNYFVYDIDFSSQTSFTTESAADWFLTQFVEVDTRLAKKSYKGVRATCYLVSPGVAADMRKTAVTSGGFIQNPEYLYINDFVGTFGPNAAPILQYSDIRDEVESDGTTSTVWKVGYAIFKDPKNEGLSPIARGIFLPITSCPSVANFSNLTQFAEGFYFQEGAVGLFPQLVQKFRVHGTITPAFGVL